jgi:hypothetical protein
MKLPLFLAVVLVALPGWAADPPLPPTAAPGNFLFGNTTPPLPPPAPPPHTYEVWVYKLIDNKWAKQEALCLKTPDIKYLSDYEDRINVLFPSYFAVDNAPASSRAGKVPQFMVSKASGITAPPHPPEIESVIWAYKLIDGKWVKQDDHCFKSKYGLELLAYYRELVKYQNDGWYVTTNTSLTTFLFFEKMAPYYNADGTLKDPSNPPPE